MRGAPGFRVTCHRSGEHPFGSMDVQRVAGAVLQARYGTPVDLESYRIDVRIDLLGPSCQVCLQLTREGLDRRFRRVYQPRITLKTPVAYAMLRLARIGGEAAPAGAAGRLLDPFCGSGTILIEAARLFPGLDIVGVDRNPAAVEGARRNVEAAGLSGRIEVRLMDARDISSFYPAGHFRAIVTDPPYGVRLGRAIDYSALYRRLLGEAGRVLAPAGRLVLLVGKRRRPFTRAVFEHGGLSIRHARNVETSGVYPMLFVLEKMGPEGSG
jgi:putative N6-adenine-specific DNA methylase/tRNA (guanine6-N2)-methyltransferase